MEWTGQVWEVCGHSLSADTNEVLNRGLCARLFPRTYTSLRSKQQTGPELKLSKLNVSRTLSN